MPPSIQKGGGWPERAAAVSVECAMARAKKCGCQCGRRRSVQGQGPTCVRNAKDYHRCALASGHCCQNSTSMTTCGSKRRRRENTPTAQEPCATHAMREETRKRTATPSRTSLSVRAFQLIFSKALCLSEVRVNLTISQDVSFFRELRTYVAMVTYVFAEMRRGHASNSSRSFLFWPTAGRGSDGPLCPVASGIYKALKNHKLTDDLQSIPRFCLRRIRSFVRD